MMNALCIHLLSLACLFFGCRQSSTELVEWNRDPDVLRDQCISEASQEIQTTCWVQLAALHGGLGNELSGIQACAEIAKMPLSQSNPETQQVWEWECAFRLGEELAMAGDIPTGLKHCALAGRFAQNCITHAIWRSPTRAQYSTLNSDTTPSKLWAFAQERHNRSIGNLNPLSSNFQQDALNQLTGQFGLLIYLGTGIANPEPAHLKGDIGSSLRTGYAMERVRLATKDTDRWTVDDIQSLFERIFQDWSQNKQLKDDSHLNPIPLGRYAEARLSPFEKDAAKLHLYGGGRRLTHPSVQIDMHIALIEAFFWYPHTPPAWFTTWFEHPEPTIQKTAIKLFCLSNGLRSNIGIKVPIEPALQWHLTTCPLADKSP